MKNLRRAGFEVTRLLLKIGKVTKPSDGTPVLTCKKRIPQKGVFVRVRMCAEQTEPAGPRPFSQPAGQMRPAPVAPPSGGVSAMNMHTGGGEYLRLSATSFSYTVAKACLVTDLPRSKIPLPHCRYLTIAFEDTLNLVLKPFTLSKPYFGNLPRGVMQ